jgi:hypothetical protein
VVGWVGWVEMTREEEDEEIKLNRIKETNGWTDTQTGLK